MDSIHARCFDKSYNHKQKPTLYQRSFNMHHHIEIMSSNEHQNREIKWKNLRIQGAKINHYSYIISHLTFTKYP